ncbi:YcaO-like family protein [Curtobacterium sp. VKM Ac-1376]|nr:YcaO-like family protein [Curtobacterium sp. VKM Ac-1376]
MRSPGKGPSLEQSVASCLGEGLERYFTARPFRDRSLVATREQLGSEAVDP